MTEKHPLDKLFEGLDDSADVDLYNNENYTGIAIRWSGKDWGFGELTLSYDKKNNKWNADTEQCSAKSLEKILRWAVPELARLMLQLDESNDKPLYSTKSE